MCPRPADPGDRNLHLLHRPSPRIPISVAELLHRASVQNWTRESASLIGTVKIYLDQEIPIEVLRSKVKEIASASPQWDRSVVAVQVTDFKKVISARQIRT